MAAFEADRATNKQHSDHLGSSIPGEEGRRSRVSFGAPPLWSTSEQQAEWCKQTDTDLPEGMHLNALLHQNGDLYLEAECAPSSESDCCQAPLASTVDNRIDGNAAFGRNLMCYCCEECGETVDPALVAHYIAPGKGNPPKRVMPDMTAFCQHAERSRDLLDAVVATDALVTANERLDEFVSAGGADDVITGELDAANLHEGEHGIRLMGEMTRSTTPGKVIIQGWAVVDSHRGKDLLYTTPVEVDRTPDFERCLKDKPMTAGQLP